MGERLSFECGYPFGQLGGRPALIEAAEWEVVPSMKGPYGPL
jgi:hypothetical protein